MVHIVDDHDHHVGIRIVFIDQHVQLLGKARAVRRQVTRTLRQPRGGSMERKRLHTPLRAYS